MCEQIAKEQQRIKILTDTRRYGKIVTVVEGIDSSDIDMEDLARKLKTRCAAGGTTRTGRSSSRATTRRR
jgi:translation initiation factor 1